VATTLDIAVAGAVMSFDLTNLGRVAPCREALEVSQPAV
jgi:hypothetical protein